MKMFFGVLVALLTHAENAHAHIGDLGCMFGGGLFTESVYSCTLEFQDVGTNDPSAREDRNFQFEDILSGKSLLWKSDGGSSAAYVTAKGTQLRLWAALSCPIDRAVAEKDAIILSLDVSATDGNTNPVVQLWDLSVAQGRSFIANFKIDGEPANITCMRK